MPFKPRGPVAVLVAACALAAPATASADARDIARDYLNAHPDKFGVTSADVADVFVMSSYTTSGTGVTHVNVNQRHQGLEVFGGHATINVGPDGSVIFTGGRLVPIGAGGSAAPRIQAGQAVESAARALKLGDATKLRVLRRDSTKSRKTVLSGGGDLRGPDRRPAGLVAAERRRAARVAQRDRRHRRRGRASVEHDRGRQHGRGAEHRRLDVARQREGARPAAFDARTPRRSGRPRSSSRSRPSARPTRCWTGPPTGCTRGRTKARTTQGAR